MVVTKPTTTWKTFEIPCLGLPHKAKSKTFGTEWCLDWLLRMAFSYKSIVSGKGGCLQPTKNHACNHFVKGCQDAWKHTSLIQPSIIQTSYLQAKHIPWRFCGSFDSIQTSTTFAKSKLWDSSERKKTNWVVMEDSILLLIPTHTHKWNFKTLKSWNGALFLVPWRGAFQWRATSEKEICR